MVDNFKSDMHFSSRTPKLLSKTKITEDNIKEIASGQLPGLQMILTSQIDLEIQNQRELEMVRRTIFFNQYVNLRFKAELSNHALHNVTPKRPQIGERDENIYDQYHAQIYLRNRGWKVLKYLKHGEKDDLKNQCYTVEDLDRHISRNRQFFKNNGMAYLVKKKKFNYQASDSENDETQSPVLTSKYKSGVSDDAAQSFRATNSNEQYF